MEENKKKLGHEPAYPTIASFDEGVLQGSYQVGNSEAHFSGMSKRFYAACAAMKLDVTPTLLDSDMVEDEKGDYERFATGGYYVPQYNHKSLAAPKFRTVTTYEHRLVREFYKIADELLRQEAL